MKVKALKNTSASGTKLVAGKQYEISDDDYQILSRMMKVEKVIEAKKKSIKKKAVKKEEQENV